MSQIRGKVISGMCAVLFIVMPFFAAAEGEVETDVRAYFADTPVMIAIAKCESNFTQFGKGDTPLYGGMAGKMIGIFQIYGDVHQEYAGARGMDILTTAGNLAYAKHLYDREGTAPWNSSRSCWENAVETTHAANASTTSAGGSSASLTMDLGMGTIHPQVRMLQKLLNAAGFSIAPEGPGSPGNETDTYGSFTQAAVKKYQCAQKIVCEGSGLTTGYGFVGPRTRATLVNSTVIAAPQSHPDPIAVSTPTPSSDDAEIARLQAQIAELTKALNALLANRSS